MVDLDRITELVPHYLAMLILLFLVLAGIRQLTGGLNFWIELLIVLILATAYPPIVRRLGIAPSAWQKAEEE